MRWDNPVTTAKYGPPNNVHQMYFMSQAQYRQLCHFSDLGDTVISRGL